MRVFEDLIPGAPAAAVALGCFDGLHIGHRHVIAAARVDDLTPTVLTFDGGVKASAELTTGRQKLRLLEENGMEQVYLLHFKNIRDLTPEEFVDKILIDVCHAKKVCCGFNFTFGRGGKGNSDTLKHLCSAKGVAVEIVPEVLLNGETVSSTRIRKLVREGRVEEASALLGRPYGFDFEVEHGRELGRKLGTPTLNQKFAEGFLVPKFAVYAARVWVDGVPYFGVTNVGVKPTVGSDYALAETWMPEYTGGPLYGQNLLVELLAYMRPEVKFDSIEELQNAILQDGENAKGLYQKYNGSNL